MATLLAELADKIDPEQLVVVAKREADLAVVQRTGYLLGRFATSGVLEPLPKWLTKKRPGVVPLRPERIAKRRTRDRGWNILINEDIEVDD